MLDRDWYCLQYGEITTKQCEKHFSSAQPPNFCNISACFHCAPMCKTVPPSLFCTRYNSSVFISTSIAKPSNVPNASNLKFLAAGCPTVNYWLSSARNNFVLIHWDSVALLRPRPTVTLIFIHGFSLQPCGRQLLPSHFGPTEIYLVLVPLP